MVGMGQCFYSEEGCEVKSEWTTDFKVFDTYISAWVPFGEDSAVIMEIEIEFENKEPPLIISVYQEGLTFNNDEIDLTWFSIADGWAEFLLTIDSNYNLKYLNKETDLLHGPVDYVPKSFLIRGSNITLYCPSKLRRWTISEDLVTIPLAGVEEHRITLMSKKEFSPTIILEGRDRKLGWSSGHLTMIPSKTHPLPPFQQHHLNFSCQTHRDTVCTMKFGKEIEDSEILRLAEMPTSVSVKGSPGDNFFVLLHQDDLISTPNTVEPNISTSNTVGPNVSETDAVQVNRHDKQYNEKSCNIGTLPIEDTRPPMLDESKRKIQDQQTNGAFCEILLRLEEDSELEDESEDE